MKLPIESKNQSNAQHCGCHHAKQSKSDYSWRSSVRARTANRSIESFDAIVSVAAAAAAAIQSNNAISNIKFRYEHST